MIFMMLQAIEDETDRDRLANFYIEYRNLLKNKALNAIRPFQLYNGYDLADDFVQDAMARIIRNIDTVKKLSEPQLVAYAVKTVQSCALDYCRKAISEQRAVASKEVLEGSPEERTWEDTELYGTEENPIIYLGSILKELPHKDQEVLIYKYFLDYDDSKIAGILGIQPNSVRMALTRARRKVKDTWSKMQMKGELL